MEGRTSSSLMVSISLSKFEREQGDAVHSGKHLELCLAAVVRLLDHAQHHDVDQHGLFRDIVGRK